MHTHLADMVTTLARSEPDKRIFTFLYADRDEQIITAGQLHHDASRIAAILRDQGVKRGDILPLTFDHGYELVATFWGAIYLGAVPTILPYLSPETRSQAYLEHVARLARFANATTVVTMSGFQSYLEQGLADVTCRIVALPSGALDDPKQQTEPWPAVEPSEPPYIQFSSGTTGSPKGVVLSHAALLHYCRVSCEHFAATPNDVTVGWLPLYHDMGLVNQILEPLFVPHHSVLMSPAAWLSEPHRLFEAIHKFRGTITWMPNFAFRYCTRRIRDEQISGLDLSSWRIIGNASEPVFHDDLEAFAKRFAAQGVHGDALTISYGLAEHVAGVTWGTPDRAPDVDWVREEGMEERKALPAEPHALRSRGIVSCGHPLPTVVLRVVNDARQELAEREIGEVLVHSPMVFKGYYLMPEESAAALSDGWLHTGDLGYLADGVLDYRPLSHALGAEQPFYGLQARGVDGAGPIDTSIEEMAAHYVQTIKAVQPQGPYYLGGYCFGGIVAYEMARQLTAAADSVALVAIMEGYAPIGDAQRKATWREWQFVGNFVRTLPYWLRDYLRLGRMRRQARGRRIIRVARKRLLRLAGFKVALEVQDMFDGPSRPAQLQKVLESHLAAARQYSPTSYAGGVVLFRTPQRLLQAPEQDMGWSKLSTKPVDVQMIAGSHGTILEEPHVRVLAEKLRSLLSFDRLTA
jgi:acyl-CoA synthetase (AMP-forming)/AMP-acid ligase II